MRAIRLLSAAVLVFAAFCVIARMCFYKIEIGEVGVLTKEWGDGLQRKDYGPGFRLDLGPLHTWNVFDATVQTLSMAQDEGEGALQVKSSDGANVTMDITVKFRIKPGEAWALRNELGVGDSYKIKVRNEAIDAMRPVFGSMSTEDFYAPEKRGGRQTEAENKLRARLDRLHVELIAILVRDVSFEASYEKRIEEKALAKQQTNVNIAQRKAASHRGDTQKIIAETAAKVTVIDQSLEKTRRELTAQNEVEINQIMADANRAVTEQHADANLYKAQKAAEATLLMKNAEAEAQRLRQSALQGAGARNLVALEAAKNLNLTRIVISTMDNNVLDLPQLAERLGSLGLPAPAAANGGDAAKPGG